MVRPLFRSNSTKTSFVEAEQGQNGGLTMLDLDWALHVMQ